MTQEQDAANWKMLEQFKQLRAERDQREALARHWGNIFTSVGELLASGVLRGVDISKLPEKTAMLEAQQELSLLYDQIANLRRELSRVGMSNLCL
jgi:hypothetical protein